jgi:hypothetical protein
MPDRRLTSERASPQAATAELAAKAASSRAALRSRPALKPQSSQRNILSAKASISSMTPQQLRAS